MLEKLSVYVSSSSQIDVCMRTWTLTLERKIATLMGPHGFAPQAPVFVLKCFVGVNTLTNQSETLAPVKVKCLDQEVRPSFNDHICIPSYPGHMLAWRSAVMAGQVSRQMRKW